MKNVPPLIKWTGSKSTVMGELSANFPTRYNTFYDPFMGGGSTIPYSVRVRASDVFDVPVSILRAVQGGAEGVVETYRSHWERFQADEEYYYKVRNHFNETGDPSSFLFLTRTCYTGLIRFNALGEFNVSAHIGRPGLHPARFKRVVQQWARFLIGTDLSVGDYRERLEKVRPGDFVFLDPPYRGTKGQYHKNAEVFDYDALIQLMDELNSKGANWMLTLGGKDDNQIPPEIYKHCFNTLPKSSSLRRMKNANDYVSDEVYVNYDPPDIGL